jgi:hypothetical protein
VNGGVDGVVFDGRRDIESGLFNAQGHAARAREEVDCDGSCSSAQYARTWPGHVLRHPFRHRWRMPFAAEQSR